MEKRTPNDADDAGPLGQHHRHHWGPVSPFAWFLVCLCPPGKHERGLARLAQATPYIMCMFHGFGPPFAHISNTFVLQSLSNAGNVGADLLPKMQSWAKTWSACTENRV